MNTLINSPPEAYESIYMERNRRTIYFDEPRAGETVQDVQERLRNTFEGIVGGQFGEDIKDVLAAEAKVLDIHPETMTSDQFWPAHKALVKEYDTRIAEAVTGTKQNVVQAVAEEISESGNEKDTISAMLYTRLKNNWTGVADVFKYPGNTFSTAAMAAHNSMSRGIEVNLAGVVIGLAKRGLDQVDIDSYFHLLAQHESLHGVFAAWYDPDEEAIPVLSNGISIRGKGEGADWLNEATIEKFRYRKFSDPNFSYEAGVLALEIADAISPGFEKSRMRTAVLNESRGAMIGQLEDIFGPFAFEKIGVAISSVQKAKDLPAYKQKLLTLINEDKRDKASVLFDEIAIKAYEKAGGSSEVYRSDTAVFIGSLAVDVK